ncbi:MAG: hypothetical protein PVF26_14615 [Desulfobacterales bacterium]
MALFKSPIIGATTKPFWVFAPVLGPDLQVAHCESTTTCKAGGLDFTAIGGKRQGREVPHSLRVEPGAGQ